MKHIETSITINRPIDQVFTFVTDFSKAVEWQAGIVEARITSNAPRGVGTTYVWVQQIVGQKMDTSGEITAWDPPRRYEWKSVNGPFPVSGGITFRAEGNGTAVTQYADAEPGGFFKLAEGLLVKQIEGQFAQSLKTLKELLEQ
ncbi:MAG: SRPBCC family protein [Chloroflexi bacterium]|nr:SRPBCC family protein [Chloroflexota bacterium]